MPTEECAHTHREVAHKGFRTPWLYKGHLLPHLQLKQRRPPRIGKGQSKENLNLASSGKMSPLLPLSSPDHTKNMFW